MWLEIGISMSQTSHFVDIGAPSKILLINPLRNSELEMMCC
jgi:hypothetical protein